MPFTVTLAKAASLVENWVKPVIDVIGRVFALFRQASLKTTRLSEKLYYFPPSIPVIFLFLDVFASCTLFWTYLLFLSGSSNLCQLVAFVYKLLYIIYFLYLLLFLFFHLCPFITIFGLKYFVSRRQ